MKLKEIMDNKNYTEFFEDEKELLWKLRMEIRDHYPESLSKLLLVTKWNKREDVIQVSPSLCIILYICNTSLIFWLTYYEKWWQNNTSMINTWQVLSRVIQI